VIGRKSSVARVPLSYRIVVLVFFFFFASGLGALVYETLWVSRAGLAGRAPGGALRRPPWPGIR
jgi:hypothetical protein